jgi:hypothetical protein
VGEIAGVADLLAGARKTSHGSVSFALPGVTSPNCTARRPWRTWRARWCEYTIRPFMLRTVSRTNAGSNDSQRQVEPHLEARHPTSSIMASVSSLFPVISGCVCSASATSRSAHSASLAEPLANLMPGVEEVLAARHSPGPRLEGGRAVTLVGVGVLEVPKAARPGRLQRPDRVPGRWRCGRRGFLLPGIQEDVGALLEVGAADDGAELQSQFGCQVEQRPAATGVDIHGKSDRAVRVDAHRVVSEPGGPPHRFLQARLLAGAVKYPRNRSNRD